VILRDVREKDMESLLRFMYNGEVHIGQEQLSDFLKTAQMLQVRGLADVPTKDNQKIPPVSIFHSFYKLKGLYSLILIMFRFFPPIHEILNGYF
jgi:hypothetical protein